MEPDTTYFTLQEIAKRLKVHEATVRRWVVRDGLYAIRTSKGGSYRVPATALDDFLRRQAVSA